MGLFADSQICDFYTFPNEELEENRWKDGNERYQVSWQQQKKKNREEDSNDRKVVSKPVEKACSGNFNLCFLKITLNSLLTNLLALFLNFQLIDKQEITVGLVDV